jgi:hypothetical protein
MTMSEKRSFDLADLQAADLPRATCESCGIVLSVKDDTTEEMRAEATAERDEIVRKTDAYLQDFAASTKCPGCAQQLGGMFGTFTYGICYGEGHCHSCGYPCRANHKTPDLDWLMVLPYHPSVLVPREEQQPA